MFPRKQRIPRQNINTIFTQKKAVFGDFFVVKTAQNNLTKARFAVVIPKKVEKSSVKRHLLKRQIINIVLDLEKELGEFKKDDFLIFINKPTKEFSYLQKQESIKKTILDNKVLFFTNL
jgi:ribonuclease P protein component